MICNSVVSLAMWSGITFNKSVFINLRKFRLFIYSVNFISLRFCSTEINIFDQCAGAQLVSLETGLPKTIHGTDSSLSLQ